MWLDEGAAIEAQIIFFIFLAHHGTRQRRTQLPRPLTLSPRTLHDLACRPAYSFQLDLWNFASDLLNLLTGVFFKITLSQSEWFLAFHFVTNSWNQSRTASFPRHRKVGTVQIIASGAAVLAVGGGLCRALICSLQHPVGCPQRHATRCNEMKWQRGFRIL